MKIKVTKYDGVDHLELLKELVSITDNWNMEITLGSLTSDGHQEAVIASELAPFIVLQQLQWIADNSEIIESMNIELDIR